MLLLFLIGGDVARASAPTGVFGNADSFGDVAGTFSQTLYNGLIRMRAMSLEDAEPGGTLRANAPGDRPLVFRAIVSSGPHESTCGSFDATLADARGLAFSGRALDEGWDLQASAAAWTVLGFSVPAGFVPTKIVLSIAGKPNARAFRLTVRPNDLAAGRRSNCRSHPSDSDR